MDDMTIKTIIFDLDGTITQPCIDFDAIRRDMGFAPDAGPILELMQKMTPQQRLLADQVLYTHEQRAIESSTLNTGAAETLSAIHQAGLPIGILTRNLKENALAVGQKHALHFDFIVGREDGPAKPDPFGVLHICQAFAVPPREAMVVGDYLFDLLCARNAGAIPVWFRNSKASEDFASFADHTIDALPQLLAIIAAANHNKENANA
jgi:HAD superfamily hydrolase (TIGR01549 family)